MAEQAPRPRMRGLFVALLFISWGVLALRLMGELQGWGPPWVGEAGSDAGGGGALLGVAWLMPLAGLLFGWKLERGGLGPKYPGRALALGGIGFGVVVLGFALGRFLIGFENDGIYAVMIGAVAGGLISLSGWRHLGMLLLGYGVLVRLANVGLTFLAVHQDWGTHLEKPHPAIPPMEPMERAIGLSMAQMFFWVPLTVVVGCLLGGVVALLVDRRRP